jgi:hypothetical protein
MIGTGRVTLAIAGVIFIFTTISDDFFLTYAIDANETITAIFIIVARFRPTF